ncbi:hypothetical protein FTUN_6464 [Frigoriglobus tundricola]|uniref:Uncharacterized protein n=1 Tax=Frigoriglobus tundricola TaxID=2774151 RepID=A0A6M5YXY0_9BACT|nr:hypothetical protein FTUN_6464 [Frigoriglobus tundricola]
MSFKTPKMRARSHMHHLPPSRAIPHHGNCGAVTGQPPSGHADLFATIRATLTYRPAGTTHWPLSTAYPNSL